MRLKHANMWRLSELTTSECCGSFIVNDRCVSEDLEGLLLPSKQNTVGFCPGVTFVLLYYVAFVCNGILRFPDSVCDSVSLNECFLP